MPDLLTFPAQPLLSNAESVPRTQREIKLEISRLMKIRGIVSVKKQSQSERHAFIEEMAAECGMPASIEAELRESADALAECSDWITDAMMRSAVDYQMWVLKTGADLYEISDTLDGVEGGWYIESAALNVLDWLRGEDPSPSEEWLTLMGGEVKRVN